MGQPFLICERVYLRPLEPEDAEGPYLGWFNDPEVCRYNSHFVLPFRKQEALDYIAATAGSGTELVLAIVLKHDERHIGNIALKNIDFVNRQAELAIVLGERDCWGQGYSKEAGLALVRHGFEVLNMHRIHCATAAENAAMRRLAQYVGMREEGVRREAIYKFGRYLDHVEYGVLRDEFKARTSL